MRSAASSVIAMPLSTGPQTGPAGDSPFAELCGVLAPALRCLLRCHMCPCFLAPRLLSLSLQCSDFHINGSVTQPSKLFHPPPPSSTTSWCGGLAVRWTTPTHPGGRPHNRRPPRRHGRHPTPERQTAQAAPPHRGRTTAVGDHRTLQRHRPRRVELRPTVHLTCAQAHPTNPIVPV